MNEERVCQILADIKETKMINTEMLDYFIKVLYEVHGETLSNPDEFVLDDETLKRFVRREQQATISKCAQLFWKLFYAHDFEYGISDVAVENSVMDFMKSHGILGIDNIEADVNNNHLVIALTLLAMAEQRITLVPKPHTVIGWDKDLAHILRKIISNESAPPSMVICRVLNSMFARCYYVPKSSAGVVRYQNRSGTIVNCSFVTHIYPHHRPNAEFLGLADFFITKVSKRKDHV
jgi:hypothetical protein